MTKQGNGVSKAEVQSTELNKLPVAGEADTEFSAEEAAEAFENSNGANQAAASAADAFKENE
ncbi:hypothetical protein [Paenibacillus sp. OV219]|uniref:hypothetical protein n=1 Tax=Paenibacillus sp. OV219 TaxID=1884377 RepID=UPI0008C99B92|nr:hypothetical protein [Paenibacillus sp. OV219]SEM90453.1 hypothetical protein SAMN05518847_1011106 [Paenibacillus sp. OV219]